MPFLYRFNKFLKENILYFLLPTILSILLEDFFNSKIDSETSLGVIWGYLCALTPINKFIIIVITGIWIISCIVYGVIVLMMRRKKFSDGFLSIMKEHTCDMLNKVGAPSETEAPAVGYSWGYNRTLLVPSDPRGWKPEDIFISHYDSYKYRFPLANTDLPDYTSSKFEDYKKNEEKVQKIIRKHDNRTRFSAARIEQIPKKCGNKVGVDIIATDWVSLQFSWDYFRRLDKNNKPIENEDPEKKEVVEKYISGLFQENAEYSINSFCLHLILVTKQNKVILAEISKVKSNDYSSTWAATIGEQIEESDFYSGNSLHEDFVRRWVKRALMEEFDINEEEFADNGIVNELDQFVDMNSLRVLSIDMEGDINNIALTCYVKLKLSLEEFKSRKGIRTDRNENDKLCEIKLKEIPEILLGYPKNCANYHPSTYLRLFMYYLSQEFVWRTEKQFIKMIRGKNRSQNDNA